MDPSTISAFGGCFTPNLSGTQLTDPYAGGWDGSSDGNYTGTFSAQPPATHLDAYLTVIDGSGQHDFFGSYDVPGGTPVPSLYSITLLDYSKEKSSSQFNVTQITAANFDAQMTALTALRTAIDGISTGAIASDRRIAQDNFLTRVPPIATDAQRENKWLVTYEDTTTHNLYRNEIPCADLSLLGANSDVIPDLTVAPWDAFVTAFEAVVKSPAGNASNVLEVRFVGKRL